MNSSILRGELYYADLNPTIGSEQGGIRPVLIISNNIGNRHSPTVIVAAITSKAATKTSLPTHCFLEMAQPSIVLLEQIRTIDKKRLRDKVGIVNQTTMREIDRSLAISLSLSLKE